MFTISHSAAWAIATILNQAGMEVFVDDFGAKGQPIFRGANAAQVIAAAYKVIGEGGRLSEELQDIDWLTLSFEAQHVGGSFTCVELKFS